MGAELLLGKLDRVKRTGAGRWSARCPAHDDKGPSLAVRELDDGRILVHCFAGCSVHEVVGAVGLHVADLMPRRPLADRLNGERTPFPAMDVLKAIGFEVLVVLTAGTALLAGEPFSEADRARMVLAVGRIRAALDVAGVRYE